MLKIIGALFIICRVQEFQTETGKKEKKNEDRVIFTTWPQGYLHSLAKTLCFNPLPAPAPISEGALFN